MSGELRDTLKKRLDENYAAFIESLQGKTIPDLIAMAPEITAAQQLHEELLDACDEEDMAFLLRFDDPLEVVRGYWESEITGYSHKGEMGHMLWEIRDMELYPQQAIRPPEPVPKPKIRLAYPGEDIYAVLHRAVNTLMQAGQKEQAMAAASLAFAAKERDTALRAISEFVEIEPAPAAKGKNSRKKERKSHER